MEKQRQPSPKKQEQQQGGHSEKRKHQQQQQQQGSGPDNPSKHSMKEPVNQEPHWESGQGRHEPSP
jgi:hypothetical protein